MMRMRRSRLRGSSAAIHPAYPQLIECFPDLREELIDFVTAFVAWEEDAFTTQTFHAFQRVHQWTAQALWHTLENRNLSRFNSRLRIERRRS